MEPKKTKKADLEPKRFLFLLIGFVLSMGFVLTAFMGSREVPVAPVLGTMQTPDPGTEIFLPPIPEKPKLPPPPKPFFAPYIEVVADHLLLDEPDFASTEITEGIPIDVIPAMRPDKPDQREEDIVVVAEVMPEFPGGEQSLLKWIAQQVHYPDIALENEIGGTVIVSFVVDRDGSISQIRLLRGIDPSLDQEALRVVAAMPRWKPGFSGGRTVRVSYNLPIRFLLKQ
ncbi:MAG TPA: energy transducer TonB [Prolixibacteraceae bacterium]|nr:energy transducer TonB [Prolixibacteraceae bacterium]